jgi:hypothetical protein
MRKTVGNGSAVADAIGHVLAPTGELGRLAYLKQIDLMAEIAAFSNWRP